MYRDGGLGRGHRAADEDHALGADLGGELRQDRSAPTGAACLARVPPGPACPRRLRPGSRAPARRRASATWPRRPRWCPPAPRFAGTARPLACSSATSGSASAARSSGRRRLPLPRRRPRRVYPRRDRQRATPAATSTDPPTTAASDYPGGLAGELGAHPGPVQAGYLMTTSVETAAARNTTTDWSERSWLWKSIGRPQASVMAARSPKKSCSRRKPSDRFLRTGAIRLGSPMAGASRGPSAVTAGARPAGAGRDPPHPRIPSLLLRPRVPPYGAPAGRITGVRLGYGEHQISGGP